MRALILSDIHSNLEAFQAVLDDASGRHGFDEVWYLGDTLGYGPDPGECIELLRSYDPAIVMGNHDLAAAGKLSTRDFNTAARLAAQWTASQLSPEHARFLAELPDVVLKGNFTLVHGSLRSPLVEYVISTESARGTFRLLQSRYCLVGHSHIPFVCREQGPMCSFEDFPEGEGIPLGGERLIINPGGVGQPRDRDPRPSYAIYDDDCGIIERSRVTYGIKTVQEKMRHAGLPEELIRRLDYGV